MGNIVALSKQNKVKPIEEESKLTNDKILSNYLFQINDLKLLDNVAISNIHWMSGNDKTQVIIAQNNMLRYVVSMCVEKNN